MDCDLKTIWESCSGNLLSFIKSKVQSEFDAEDILQDVFLKLHRNIGNLKDSSKLQAYIYRTVNNTIIDYYKKRKDEIMTDGEIPEHIALEEEKGNLNEEVARCIRDMIFRLPEKYQRPMELHDIMGRHHKEISRELNISVSGSKTRVQRARIKLKEFLFECCDFELDSMGNVIDYKRKKH